VSAAARRFAPAAATTLLFAVTLASTAIWTRNIGIEEDWKMVPPWEPTRGIREISPRSSR
jgi:hypothetical protein